MVAATLMATLVMLLTLDDDLRALAGTDNANIMIALAMLATMMAMMLANTAMRMASAMMMGMTVKTDMLAVRGMMVVLVSTMRVIMKMTSLVVTDRSLKPTAPSSSILFYLVPNSRNGGVTGPAFSWQPGCFPLGMSRPNKHMEARLREQKASQSL